MKAIDEIELACDLIRIDSQNPPGREGNCARFLRDLLEDRFRDLEIKTFSWGEDRMDLLAKIGGEEGGLMLNGHLDTVPIGDPNMWSWDPLSGREHDGKIIGRGASDMKSAVAAMISAAHHFLRNNDPKKKVALFFTSDEEVASRGLRRIIEGERHILNGISYGIIGEPTELKVVRMHKGIYYTRIEVTGDSAHGSTPEYGVNAIEKASEIIKRLQGLKVALNFKEHDVGKPTLNVGKIEGGTKVNMVPDRCVIDIDRRVIPTESVEEVLSEFWRVIDDGEDGTNVEITGYRAPHEISKDSVIIREMENITESRAGGISYWTEAPVFHQAGVECAVVGPGSVMQAHAFDEHVPIEEVKKARRIYERALKRICL